MPPSDVATTRWSLVLSAGARSSPASEAALAELCQRYWYPLYVFVRRKVGNVDQASDLIQEFFARLLEKQTLAHADPERGRFRSFLLTSLKNFLANEWDKAKAHKRGGGRTILRLEFSDKEDRLLCEPAHACTPERLFERQWALTLLDQVLAELRGEYAAAGKTALFECLKGSLTGDAASLPLADAAKQLGMSEGAVKTAAHRLRKRYRELLRAEVAHTVAGPDEVDEELRGLFAALAPDNV
jgi:RNA polymerase sigma-70 factor (ECF subfamily)